METVNSKSKDGLRIAADYYKVENHVQKQYGKL